MEKENILQIFWGHIHGYFTLRGARKVFFFSLLAVFLSAIIVNFFNSDVTFKILFATCAACALSTLVDSFQAKSEYMNEVSKIELAAGDELLIKNKKRDFNYSIIIKSVFLIIFLVLFVQGI